MDLLFRFGYRLVYQLLCLWWFVRRPAAEGAAIAVWHEGCLLVVRTSYRAGFDLPGGGIDRGETARAGAVRELAEELGLQAPAAALVEADSLTFTADHRRITQHVFVWRPEQRPAPVIDRREIVWAGYLRPAELTGQPLSPGLHHYLVKVVASSADHADTEIR